MDNFPDSPECGERNKEVWNELVELLSKESEIDSSTLIYHLNLICSFSVIVADLRGITSREVLSEAIAQAELGGMQQVYVWLKMQFMLFNSLN